MCLLGSFSLSSEFYQVTQRSTHHSLIHNANFKRRRLCSTSTCSFGDVLDTGLADTKSETPPSNEILQTCNKPSFSVQTVLLAVDCLPTTEDSNADGTKSSSRTISHDILHEILSRMPAKSAIKFSSSLCKWSIIHSDPRFVEKQCILSCDQENAFFLQQKKRQSNKAPNKLEFHLLPSETNSAFGIPSESLNFLPKSGRILSSSNGLLLLCNPSLSGCHEFKVCNPAIREWAPVPIPGDGRILFDEDFLPLIECYPWGQEKNVEFPNDYTIAFPVSYSMCWRMINGRMGRVHKQDLLIYSNGRWDEELCEVGAVDHLVRFDMPVAIFSNKGLILHYLCDSDPPKYPRFLEPYIAAFNLEEKKLARNIKLPEGAWNREVAEKHGASEKKLMIFKWNETSICLVRWWFGHGEIKAWVLDHCGRGNEAWRVVIDSSMSELLDDRVVSVGVAGGGRGLLIATAPPADDVSDGFSRVFVYVVDGENRGRLELVGEHCFGFERDSSGDCETLRFLPYANTLRPVSVLNSETLTY